MVYRSEYGDGYFHNYAGLNMNYGTPVWNIYGNYNYTNQLRENEILAEIIYKNSGNYMRNLAEHERDDQGHRLRFGLVADFTENHRIGAEFYGRAGMYDVTRNSDFSMANGARLIDSGIIIGETAVENYTVNGTLNYSWKLDSLNSKFKVVGDYSRYELNDESDIVSEYEFDVYEDLLENNQFDR